LQFLDLFSQSGQDIIKTMARSNNIEFSDLGRNFSKDKLSVIQYYLDKYKKNPQLNIPEITVPRLNMYSQLARQSDNQITIEDIHYALYSFGEYTVEQQEAEEAAGSSLSPNENIWGLLLFSSKIAVHQQIIEEQPYKFLNLAQINDICKLRTLGDVLRGIFKINDYGYLSVVFKKEGEFFDDDNRVTQGDTQRNIQGIRLMYKDATIMIKITDINQCLDLLKTNCNGNRDELSKRLFIKKIDTYSLQLFMHYLGYPSITYINRSCRYSNTIKSLDDLTPAILDSKNSLKICNIQFLDIHKGGKKRNYKKKKRITKKKKITKKKRITKKHKF